VIKILELLFTLAGVMFGIYLTCWFFQYKIQHGHINKLMKFLDIKKQFSEITIPSPPAKPTPDK